MPRIRCPLCLCSSGHGTADGSVMSLGDERDPNVGMQNDGAVFTIPHAPVRRRMHGIDTFNVVRGGESFFMPSLSALRWLGDLA